MRKPFIFRMQVNYLLLFALSLFCLNYNSHGQGFTEPHDYVLSMVPLNPTAASLAEYGNVPVSLFRGKTNISIPIYSIKKDWITLPIYLSYNSGGMKVEEVASWVGMGWSLNFGGSISRQVRGKADYIDSSYAVNLQRKAVDFLTYPNQDDFYFTNRTQYINEVMEGLQDPEMDIYFINMNNFAGKMFYDTTGHLITIPNSRLKVQYLDIITNGGWKVTTTDGTQYYFLAQEYSQSLTIPVQPSAPGQFALTNWYVSKIINANNTDSILFEYGDSGYGFEALGTETHYDKGSCGPCSAMTPGTVITTKNNSFNTKRLTKIISHGLEIDFNIKSTERCDLPGAYALDNIQVKDWKNDIFNNYQLYQSYRVGNHIETTCTSTSPEYKRLFLDSIRVKGASGVYEPYYKMKYNDSIVYPSRLSTRQDHWGYYSRKGDPSSLIPSLSYNRAPDTSWNQIGILKSLYYPTGGYSEFRYETNTAGNLSPEISNEIKEKSLSAVDTPQIAGGTVTINFTIPSTEEPINDSISIFNSLMNSGSTLNPLPGDPNPPYLGNATISLTNNNTGISTSIPYRGNQKIRVLINTSYTLKASYFLYDPSINSFYLNIKWNYFGDNQGDKLVGGLRIKEIRDFDRTGNLVNMKQYGYSIPNSDSSSGIIEGIPMYATHLVKSSEYINNNFSFCCFKATQSYSNYPLVADNGLLVGYSYVNEKLGINGAGGMNEYYYSVAPFGNRTSYFGTFPFPPPLYHVWQEGYLQRVNSYKKNVGGFTLVQSKGYNYKIYDTYQSLFSWSIKMGLDATYTDEQQGSGGPPTLFKYIVRDYFTYSGRHELISDTITDYRNGVPVSTVTTYHYDPDYFYKTNESLVNSDGIVSKTAYTYPPDMAASSVKTAMLNKNMIGLPVTTKTYSNGTLTSTEKNNYGLFNSGQVQLKNKQSSTYNHGLQTEITFNKYDAKGNLLSYTTQQGISTVFIWGYKGTYPVAQIEHVDTSAFTAYLNNHPGIKNTCNNPSSDQALRNVIQQIRNQFPTARITGMTYRPPLGMTSKTDPNNIVTYYEYDAFGRLAYIKDKDGKILKKYTYHYKQ